MHNSTYNSLVMERDTLKRELGAAMPSSAAYGTLVTAWWQPEGPLLMNNGELVLGAPTSGDWR